MDCRFLFSKGGEGVTSINETSDSITLYSVFYAGSNILVN